MIGSVTVDSRDTPYSPVWDLDNVLIYGCDHWDFSSQTKDGLEIEIEQLRHSSFVVNPNDPTRHDRKLVVYVAPFTGPGSYRAEGLYAANERSTRFFARDACDVDVAASDDGGIHGTFSCRIPAGDGAAGAIDLAGEFGCPLTRWILCSRGGHRARQPRPAFLYCLPMRALLAVCLVGAFASRAAADRSTIRCDNQSTADLSVDGMLDDWGKEVVTRIGVASDGQFALRCSWTAKRSRCRSICSTIASCASAAARGSRITSASRSPRADDP